MTCEHYKNCPAYDPSNKPCNDYNMSCPQHDAFDIERERKSLHTRKLLFRKRLEDKLIRGPDL